MTTYRVTLWKGGFTVGPVESEAEAREDALMTVVEDRSWFELEEVADEDDGA